MPANQHDDWDPTAAAVLADQVGAYDRMRQRCPVAYSEYQGWTVFRHEQVAEVIHHPDRFSNNVSQHLSVPNGMDPPEHGPFRELINPYFSADVVDGFEPACHRIVDDLLAAVARGGDIEIMSQLAYPFAARAQCAFLGWSEELAPTLAEWVRANQQATLGQDRPTLKRLAEQFHGHVTEALQQRRDAGVTGDDITSCLMRETIDGRALTDEELTSILRNWTVGEIGTLSASIGILVHTLATESELQEWLRQDPRDVPDAVEEILRWHGPLVDNRRVARQSTLLRGRRIEAGERVTINWIAANRDPKVFDEADAIQIDRDQSHNLLWGAGIHGCPGAPLAQMELRVVLEAILKASAHLALSQGEPAEPARYPASGYRRVPLRISAAGPAG